MVVLGLGAALLGLRALAFRRRAAARLRPAPDAPPPEPPPAGLRVPAWVSSLSVIGVLVAAGLVLSGELPTLLAVALGLVASVLGGLASSGWRAQHAGRLEGQLADAIDLMLGALRAGSGLLDALENAAREVPTPLRPELDLVVERIRLGDTPVEVFEDLGQRVPLEPFALFATTLAVQWETGGALSGTLASVGQAIRDKNELKRRVRAQSTQARVSVIGVLGICYLLAITSWAADPERIRAFLDTRLGAWFAAATVALQAVGLLWIARLSRVEEGS